MAKEICDSLRHELNWTHYSIFLRKEDPVASQLYRLQMLDAEPMNLVAKKDPVKK